MASPTASRAFASRLRAARKAAGLSIVAAAHKVGRGERTWRSWEAGETSPTAMVLVEVASKLGTTVAKLVGEVSRER